MKNKILLLFVASLFYSCSTCYKKEKFTYERLSNPWVEAYKYETFIACLKEGYKNDSIFKLIADKDFHLNYDEIDIINLNEAKKNGENIIKKMPTNIIIPKCEDCDIGKEKLKKYITSNCLKYYASFELDSIAKNAYSNFLKNQKQE